MASEMEMRIRKVLEKHDGWKQVDGGFIFSAVINPLSSYRQRLAAEIAKAVESCQVSCRSCGTHLTTDGCPNVECPAKQKWKIGDRHPWRGPAIR